MTAASTVWWDVYRGDILPIWNGTLWTAAQPGELSLATGFTDATATVVNASLVMTVADSKKYYVGMKLSGARLTAGTTVDGVPTATTVTLSANAASTGATTVTAALPASAVYDLFVEYTSANLRLIPWSSISGRANALVVINGVYVNSVDYQVTGANGIAAHQGTYLGTFATTGTDGRTEDSVANRLLWNNFNRINRKFSVGDATSSWALNAGTTWRSAHSSTANRVNLVVGLAEEPVEFTAFGLFSGAAQVDMEVGAAWDAVNTSDCDLSALSQISAAAAAPGVGAFVHSAVAFGRKVPAPGLHYLQWTEQTTGPANVTVYGTSGTVRKPGLLGQIRA